MKRQFLQIIKVILWAVKPHLLSIFPSCFLNSVLWHRGQTSSFFSDNAIHLISDHANIKRQIYANKNCEFKIKIFRADVAGHDMLTLGSSPDA
jgi:hypothetical protein